MIVPNSNLGESNFKSCDDHRNMVSFDISSRKNNRFYSTDTNERFSFNTEADYTNLKLNCCGVSEMSIPVSMALMPSNQRLNITIQDLSTTPTGIFTIVYTPFDSQIKDFGQMVNLINNLLSSAGSSLVFYIDNTSLSGSNTNPPYNPITAGFTSGKMYSNKYFSFKFNENASTYAPILGFDIKNTLQLPKTVFGSNTVYMTPFVPDTIPFSVVHLCCSNVNSKTSCPGEQANIIATAYYNGSNTFGYNYQSYYVMANRKYIKGNKDKIFTFYLLDEDYDPIDLQGIPFFFKFHMWYDENETANG